MPRSPKNTNPAPDSGYKDFFELINYSWRFINEDKVDLFAHLDQNGKLPCSIRSTAPIEGDEVFLNSNERRLLVEAIRLKDLSSQDGKMAVFAWLSQFWKFICCYFPNQVPSSVIVDVGYWVKHTDSSLDTMIRELTGQSLNVSFLLL